MSFRLIERTMSSGKVKYVVQHPKQHHYNDWVSAWEDVDEFDTLAEAQEYYYKMKQTEVVSEKVIG